MKKRIVGFVFCLLVFVSSLAFTAGAKIYGGTSDGITWSIELNNGYMEINGSGDVPDYLNHVSTPWGKYITLAKEISIGEGITSIGKNAFMYARIAEKITLPDSLKSIGENAFAYCYELEDINLPEGLVSIGKNAFASCKNLYDVDFPHTLTDLGSYAFSACTSLEISDLSGTKITEIGEGTFSSCTSLVNVKLPETVTLIGDGAFFNCVNVDKYGKVISGLKSINIPSNVTYVGSKAFYNCLELYDLSFYSHPEVFADTFYNVPAKYTVTFKNRDGSIISSCIAPINTIAVYEGVKPTAESTAQYDFTFKGWDRPFENVLGDTEYTAVYTEKLRLYKLTWIVDGEVKDVRSQKYGTMPKYWGSYPDNVPKKEGYTFAKWTPFLESVTGDATYTAVFVKEGLGDFDGDGITDSSDINTLALFVSGSSQLSEEQILRANVYTDDDKEGVPPEENINIKDLIFLAQMAAAQKD